MSNFREDILIFGEEILAIVISSEGPWGGELPTAYGLRDMEPILPLEMTNRVLTWAEAEPWLDRRYDTSYGSPSCYCITAWTTDSVIFVSQYDGSTRVESVPRNPVDHKPKMPGG